MGLVSLWKPLSGGSWYSSDCRLSIRSCVTMVAKGNAGFKFHISVSSVWLRKQRTVMGWGWGWGWGRAGKAGGVGRRLLFYAEAASKAASVYGC